MLCMKCQIVMPWSCYFVLHVQYMLARPCMCIYMQTHHEILCMISMQVDVL